MPKWIKFVSFVFSISALLSVSFAAQPETENPYIFGIHPYLTAKELLERFTPLINYLSDELDQPVVLRVAKNYANHIQWVGEDKVDLAYLGPAPYVKLVENYGQKHLLAKIEVAGQSTFRGAIIVSQNSRIKTLTDLRGKGFAFGSPNSTMSHFVPRFVLWQAGMTVDQLSHYQFIKSHENVVLGVLLGEFEAGAIKKDIFNRYVQQGIKVLTWTPPITVHLFVATHRFPQQQLDKVRQLFLNLNEHPKGKTILTSIKKSITGVTKVDDQDYNELRYILRTVEQLKNQEKSRQ
ncbi:MAG: phosphate/phosphite/phosphonate ABC transporter substrate-binding protein [Candidatus Parabeggiatoa sp.]|nr:phosphate/phosphite/phosphonate ABC transporter substrate-binding protein [Candidatus Parabeggiatoa sp.]